MKESTPSPRALAWFFALCFIAFLVTLILVATYI